ncbi:MAG: cytochrome c [Holophagales bacterium]|nr:cytochrome c [Holophagales bacterium]MYG31498.1 cytochrome c [Holophagales bacterium]MYI78432.1 cytochrome c [Holophagales bacterium]
MATRRAFLTAVGVTVPVLASTLACSTAIVTTPPSAPAQAPPAAAESEPAAPPASVLDGIFTEAQAKRGRAAYDAQCAECHGEGLGGGEMAPGLTGVAFRFRWRGLKVADIYTSVQSTMPPEEPGTLGDQAYIDIVAFLLSANGYPAGDWELLANSSLLEGIAVERMLP